MLRLSLCLLIICGCLVVSPSLDAVAGIQLREQVILDHAQVYLSDIADNNGMKSADWDQISEMAIQRLAGIGPYTISARRVMILLRSKGVHKEVRIRGSVEVRRRMRTIDAAELYAAAHADIEQRIQAQDADRQWSGIEITQSRAGKELSVCAQEVRLGTFVDVSERDRQNEGGVHLIAESLSDNIFGEVPYRVRAMEGTRERGRSLLVLSVRARRDVAVLSRGLEKDHVIGYGDLRVESILVDQHQQQEAPSVDEVVGKVLRVALTKGAIVHNSVLRKEYAVHGGQEVDMVYTRTQFQLSARGIAQGTASVGDTVKVRSVNGGRTINARVIAKDLVQID